MGPCFSGTLVYVPLHKPSLQVPVTFGGNTAVEQNPTADLVLLEPPKRSGSMKDLEHRGIFSHFGLTPCMGLEPSTLFHMLPW